MDQAQKEKLLLSNCTWAVTHATRTIEVLRTKHKFKECAAMAKLKAAAAAYLSKVSDEDVAYVEQEKLRAAAEKKRPASNQALVSPAPLKRAATIDLTGNKLSVGKEKLVLIYYERMHFSEKSDMELNMTSNQSV